MSEQIEKLVDACEALTGEVEKQASKVNEAVQQGINRIDDYLVSARTEAPIYRQSKNQAGKITNNTLDHFTKNGAFQIDLSVYREIESGLSWEERDAEEKEILTAMGLENTKWFKPKIQVISMKWSGYNQTAHSGFTLYPNPNVSGSIYTTSACYAKRLNGGIGQSWLRGINDEWGLCGSHNNGRPGAYLNAHPYVYTPSGEVLFIWPAVVSGRVPLDRENPKWGFYPSLYGENPFDDDISV